jgi:hypothetical protein
MTLLTDVLTAVRRGVPSDRLGPALGLDDNLAAAALDHWVRLGIVTPSGDLTLGCTACPAIVGQNNLTQGNLMPDDAAHVRPAAGATSAAPPPACAGCPFTR